MFEHCAICGCRLHRIANTYAQPSIAGRSHASKHFYVAERFFGRTKHRRDVPSEGIFSSCPWKQEGEFGIFCYECHKELLRNPVLLPEDVQHFAKLVKLRGLGEKTKTDSRAPIAGRVALLREVIALGIATALKREARLARKQAARELVPFLGGFAVVLFLVGFSPWIDSYSASDNVAIEGWLFFMAGLLGCALSPARPFRAAALGTVGVVLGTAVGVIVHSIIGSGSEGDFFPIQVASHAGMSAPSFLLSALVWKAGTAPIFWDMRELREIADERIRTRQRALLESLPLAIEALMREEPANGAPSSSDAIYRVVALCSNALYALAEVVLAQYDSVLAEPLIPGPFVVDRLIRAVPGLLLPLRDECIAQVRRETNLSGVPNLAVKCIAVLEAKFDTICDDVALTLRASIAERNRILLRNFGNAIFGLFSKLLGSGRP